jgi:hypothetical protein
MTTASPLVMCLASTLFFFLLVGAAFAVAVIDFHRDKPRMPRKIHRLEPGDMEGYKVLVWDGGCWASPQQVIHWTGGRLRADRKARIGSDHGIYIGKHPSDVAEYLKYPNSAMWLVGMKVSKAAPVVLCETGYLATEAYQIKIVEA